MIILFSGTPGSGKSLHTARYIYYQLLLNHPVIANFAINTKYVKHAEQFHYIDNTEITPQYLMDFSAEYFKGKGVKEDSINLVLDEAQMLFNARSWDAKNREEWNKFFTIHRHFGYKIILIAQFDRMIDRQIRSLIEYETIHRKISNFGIQGKIFSLLFLSPTLFIAVRMWYPMKLRIDSEMFRASKKYYRLYDTYLVFDNKKNDMRDVS